MAVWGVGFILGPILGPTVGGYLADEWSWRWIFYINLPVGVIGFLMGSAFLFDPPYLRRAARIDWWGLGLMVAGFGCLQLVLDRGEREDWFDSSAIVALAIVAVCALVGFLIRELTASDPILDLTVFADRNFATGATLSLFVGFGMFSGMLLVAIFTQKLLGYDAWTSGLVLAPGGLGNVFSLFASGLVTRIDQRLMLAFGCLLNAVSLYMMTSLTLGMDYWALAWPRFLQGFAVGFIFVPLSTLTLATIQRHKLVNATAVYGMARNIGGSVGIAVVTTLLAQRSQFHQATLVSHINVWDPETHGRLARWASHFAAQGSDAFTAERQAMVMLYRETVDAGPAAGLHGRLLAADRAVRGDPPAAAAHAPHPGGGGGARGCGHRGALRARTPWSATSRERLPRGRLSHAVGQDRRDLVRLRATPRPFPPPRRRLPLARGRDAPELRRHDGRGRRPRVARARADGLAVHGGRGHGGTGPPALLPGRARRRPGRPVPPTAPVDRGRGGSGRDVDGDGRCSPCSDSRAWRTSSC